MTAGRNTAIILSDSTGIYVSPMPQSSPSNCPWFLPYAYWTGLTQGEDWNSIDWDVLIVTIALKNVSRPSQESPKEKVCTLRPSNSLKSWMQ